MKHTTNILLADDHQLLRYGLKIVIESHVKNASFYHASSISEIEQRLDKCKIDYMFLDICFGDTNSINLISKFKANNANIRVIVFSGMDEEVYATPAIKAGASGYINKNITTKLLDAAIEKIFGDVDAYEREQRILFYSSDTENPLQSLSEREMEITKLLAEGYGNLEICNALKLRKSTVSTFIKRIKQKLEINHLSQIPTIYNTYKHTFDI